ncbi:MAG: hypothetical protein DDT40_01406 [candidate division WS2 bacterium]|nr:hypothetical protein [Candidatus Psychracetigena formicireducens]
MDARASDALSSEDKLSKDISAVSSGFIIFNLLAVSSLCSAERVSHTLLAAVRPGRRNILAAATGFSTRRALTSASSSRREGSLGISFMGYTKGITSSGRTLSMAFSILLI